jgi:methionyl-tRNA formyltransferase
MRNNIFFANDIVGLECVIYLIDNSPDEIHSIVVTDEESVVYKKLLEINYNDSKIIFIKDFLNNSFEDIHYIFLLWWPHIIGDEIIKIPKFGVINTHPSLLPYNRGKNYNFWNLVEDVPFGVSLHFIGKKIDGGDIIFQNEILKSWEDTGESLYYKAKQEMIKLFKEKYEKIIENKYVRVKQNLDEGSFHYSNELENASQIFLEKNYKASELLNLLRAKTFPPYNGCFFIDNNNKYEILIEIKKKK